MCLFWNLYTGSYLFHCWRANYIFSWMIRCCHEPFWSGLLLQWCERLIISKSSKLLKREVCLIFMISQTLDLGSLFCFELSMVPFQVWHCPTRGQKGTMGVLQDSIARQTRFQLKNSQSLMVSIALLLCQIFLCNGTRPTLDCWVGFSFTGPVPVFLKDEWQRAESFWCQLGLWQW